MRREPATVTPETPPSTVALLQYGPCWCRGVPGETGSFDFVRHRKVELDLGPLGANIVIVSERLLSPTVAEVVFRGVPSPKIVVAAAVCPAARGFWDRAPISWVPADEVLPVDVAIDACISGEPEALLGAMLSRLSDRAVTQSSVRLTEAIAQ